MIRQTFGQLSLIEIYMNYSINAKIIFKTYTIKFHNQICEQILIYILIKDPISGTDHNKNLTNINFEINWKQGL